MCYLAYFVIVFQIYRISSFHCTRNEMAAAALAAVTAGIEAGSKGIDLTEKSINLFNTLVGSSANIWDKNRPLEIIIVNISTSASLLMEDSWFDSGRFWSQPGFSIGPGQSATFHVCNKDGGIMTGVSGGVGFRASNMAGQKLDNWLICTFSNPWSGGIKGKIAIKGFGIKPLWEDMDNANVIHGDRCGFYKKDDRKLVFIYKEASTRW